MFYYGKGNYDDINDGLARFFPYFLELADDISIDDLWKIFKSNVHALVNKHVPSGTQSSKIKKKQALGDKRGEADN